MYEREYEGKNAVQTLELYKDRYSKAGYLTEPWLVARAIGEVLPKLEKQEHIMAVEYTDHIGPYAVQMMAVFDDRQVTDKEVRDFICGGESYHQHIVTMYRDQFESIFQSFNPQDGGKEAGKHGQAEN